MEIKIAVKELAYFVCQSGNLTLEFFSNRDALIGSKIHTYLQSRYNEESKSEVYVKNNFFYNGYDVILSGFIDGVLNVDGQIIIEEIKSTTKELDEIDFNEHKQYLAQVRIYSYLYGLLNSLDPISYRLTFASTVDYSTKSFDFTESLDSLESFVFDVLEEYLRFVDLNNKAQEAKETTLKNVKFPFETLRQGQRDMMRACYKALKNEDILYVVAPTGIGKTMAALFSALKTLEKNDKLFYLTAKGTGKQAPIQAIKILATKGLKIKAINLIAKKKICNAKMRNCKPDECPFAIGFFDRLKDATMEIFAEYDIYDEETISLIANKHRICAFEFSLNLAYYCDVIVADYNYAFDPRVQLMRFFADDTYNAKVLVDEAHNLISRSKEMYQATIGESDIRAIRKALTGLKPSIRSDCNKVIEKMNEYKDLIVEGTSYVSQFNDSDLVVMLRNLVNRCDNIFSDNKSFNHKDEALDVYFKLLDFLTVSDYFSLNHRFFVKLEKEDCLITLLCLDASDYILQTIKECLKGIVFFSATLTPFKYHADLLTKGEGHFLELASPFDPQNLKIIINRGVSTKYKQRTQSIDYILEAIETLTAAKAGNYIVFFPSYQYLNMVASALDSCNFEVLIQKSDLDESQRTKLLERFDDTANCKVGLFVMGGSFSEGIDYVGDRLNGVVVVGVGLPLICEENELLKDHFEELYANGFDYAYTYPGFTKVVQAVGRVIRSEDDRGVAILLDERFGYYKYQDLMPRHWVNRKFISDSYQLKKELEKFFSKGE